MSFPAQYSSARELIQLEGNEPRLYRDRGPRAASSANLTADGQPEQVLPGVARAPNFFAVLGVTPAHAPARIVGRGRGSNGCPGHADPVTASGSGAAEPTRPSSDPRSR